MNLLHYTPPVGTTITRVMTYTERRRAARLGYAQTVTHELRCIFQLARSPGTLKVHHNNYIVCVSYDNAGKAIVNMLHRRTGSKYSMCIPFYGPSDQQNVESWLACQDPCFGARLLKNAYKQLRDRASVEGQRKAQLAIKPKVAEPHSQMTCDEFPW
jgi:hypothetical protein